MSYKIHLKPSGHEFEHEGRETILRSGMRSGLNLAHNCMNGSCGNCRAKLLDGDIEQVRHHDFRLSDEQKSNQQFLTCCHKPLSDLKLEMHELDTVQQIPYQEITVKVSKTELLADDVMHLQLRASRSQVLDFLAGQKVQLCMKDGSSVQLGISSCPCDGLNLRFHIRNSGGEFCNRVFSQLKKGEKLQIKGPVGEFTLNESSARPLVFVAWDTGFAQVQSIIDHVISENAERSIRLLWLSESKHYFENSCRAWRDVLDDFQYETIYCSEAEIEPVLSDKLGAMTLLADYEVYAVLPQSCLSSVPQIFNNAGCEDQQFFMDSL